jgi:hypothetical protein
MHTSSSAGSASPTVRASSSSRIPAGWSPSYTKATPLGGQAEDLKLGDAVPAAQVQRLQFPGPGWVFLDDERCRMNSDPAMIRTLFYLNQQPVSALQPPAGHGGFVAELQVVRGQPSGHPGCRRGVTLLDVAPVGPLTRPEGQLSVIEAIATPAQPLQAIRCLLLGQRRLKQRPRPGPVTLPKRLPAGLQRP